MNYNAKMILVVVFSPLPWYDVSMRNVMGKARSICDMVAGGKSVLDACRRVRVSRATFYRWAAGRPDVAELYQKACRARLDAVENELSLVEDEITRLRATVPDERPRDGVYFGEFIRAIRNPFTPAAILERMHPRMSRRAYRRKRQRMRGLLVLPRLRWEALRLERARLLRRLK